MRILTALFFMIQITPVKSYDRYDNYRVSDPCYSKVIHWKVTPVNPYENTLIVIDPYKEEE